MTNRFKGLDLIDRVPDELWTEVQNIVQEAVIKTIPKKCKKAKWLSEETLKIAMKREVKGKGENERYTHLNPEFQRILRRDKKAFLSYQCEEIEENNRIRNSRCLFKKITDTKRTFLAKMATRKNRNGMNLTEVEDIKKRWQEYTEELYKKGLNDPGKRDGVITQFSSVTQSCLTLCDPMNCSTPCLHVHQQLPKFTQTHVHRVSDAIQSSRPLSFPSPPAPKPSQQQSLFQ